MTLLIANKVHSAVLSIIISYSTSASGLFIMIINPDNAILLKKEKQRQQQQVHDDAQVTPVFATVSRLMYRSG